MTTLVWNQFFLHVNAIKWFQNFALNTRHCYEAEDKIIYDYSNIKPQPFSIILLNYLTCKTSKIYIKPKFLTKAIIFFNCLQFLEKNNISPNFWVALGSLM